MRRYSSDGDVIAAPFSGEALPMLITSGIPIISTSINIRETIYRLSINILLPGDINAIFDIDIVLAVRILLRDLEVALQTYRLFQCRPELRVEARCLTDSVVLPEERNYEAPTDGLH